MPDGENFQTAWIVDFFTAVPVYTVEAVQAFTADTLFCMNIPRKFHGTRRD